MNSGMLSNSVVSRLVLLLSGLIAIGIALVILVAPEVFYASYGIELGGNRNLINELKASAGMLLFAGMIILVGSFRTELTVLSMAIAAALFLSFGLSRILSMIVDGVPHDALVSAAVVEVAIGAICLINLISRKKVQRLQNA